MIAAADGCIIAEKLQIEGDRKISAADFVKTIELTAGEIMG